MDTIYTQLAEHMEAAASKQYPRRLIVGIAGPPGSGKTTIAAQVTRLLNESAQRAGIRSTVAVTVPMDGFHYTRAQLDGFTNATEAHKRRGAPWTFDVDAVLDLVERLHQSTQRTQRSDILAPSFDHAIKDPLKDTICIPGEAYIILMEGNYLLLNQGRWADISAMLDYRVLIKVSREQARRRIASRHVSAGIEPDLELAGKRYDSNDGLNGDLILANVTACDAVVHSVPLEENADGHDLTSVDSK